MKAIRTAFILCVAPSLCANTAGTDYGKAARELDGIIAKKYAYHDKLPHGDLPLSDSLTAERKAVHDNWTIFAYAEKRIAWLVDHPAIIGSSFRDSWTTVPTYTYLWVVKQGAEFVIDAVRGGSSANDEGVVIGEIIIAVDDLPIGRAVSGFWADIGLNAQWLMSL